jgi:hypothetical protein
MNSTTLAPTGIRLTHNAVAGYQRQLARDNSVSSAYAQLKGACARGRYACEPPVWLRRTCGENEGYVMLEGDIAALPVRRGRVVACLVNPQRATR